MTSTETARAAITAGLQTLTPAGQPLAGVDVVRTGRWQNTVTDDQVAVLTAVDIEVEEMMQGARLAETYIIPILVSVRRAGGEPEGAENRAVEIMSGIHAWIVANRPLVAQPPVIAFVSTRLIGREDDQSRPDGSEDYFRATTTLRYEIQARVALT